MPRWGISNVAMGFNPSELFRISLCLFGGLKPAAILEIPQRGNLKQSSQSS
jgi:hypothetical protein